MEVLAHKPADIISFNVTGADSTLAPNSSIDFVSIHFLAYLYAKWPARLANKKWSASGLPPNVHIFFESQ